MVLLGAALSAVIAGIVMVAYVVWKFIRRARQEGAGRPPTLWSLPLIGSLWFLPDFSRWHREFLIMSTNIGNIFAFYMGSRYVSCTLLTQSAALCLYGLFTPPTRTRNKCLANAKRPCDCRVLCLRLKSLLCICALPISDMTRDWT